MSSVEGFPLASAAFRFMSSTSPFKKAMKYRTRSNFEFELALRRLTDGDFGVGQAIQEELAECLAVIGGPASIRIKSEGLVGCGDRQLVFAGADRGQTGQQSERNRIARIGPRPRLHRLLLPFQIAGHLTVVKRIDQEPLDVAGPIAQAVRLERALPRQRPFSDVAVMDPEPCMGDRKVRVDRDRTLEQRQGRGGVA